MTTYRIYAGYTTMTQLLGSSCNIQRVCSAESSIPEAQLNYPSFSIILGSNLERYTKTVTNVGEANSSYTVQIAPPAGVDVTVEPSTLNFSGLNQKITYTVTFARLANSGSAGYSQGLLTWNSDKHSVRSPISVILNSMKKVVAKLSNLGGCWVFGLSTYVEKSKN